MTAPAYTDRERQARALLAEEANRILLANPGLIAARIELGSDRIPCDCTVFVTDHLGERHIGCGDCIIDALKSAMGKVRDAHALAEEKRKRAAELTQQAADLMAEAARLEQSAAA